MKHHFLFLLLFCCSSANAQDSEKLNEDALEPKKGDTIWLEEKISPTTTWIESLVRPFTEWMEDAIQEPEREPPEMVLPIVDEHVDEATATNSTVVEKSQVLIGVEQAKESARKLVDGDVLYIKLVSKTNQYRVKLISKLGEVRVIYIDASSGTLVEKGAKKLEKSSVDSSTETDSQVETPSSEAP